MNNYRKHLKTALIGALGYGLGFVIGVVLIKLIFNSARSYLIGRILL